MNSIKTKIDGNSANDNQLPKSEISHFGSACNFGMLDVKLCSALDKSVAEHGFPSSVQSSPCTFLTISDDAGGRHLIKVSQLSRSLACFLASPGW